MADGRGRRRPANVDIGSAQTSLFSMPRPNTPSKTPTKGAVNGHSKRKGKDRSRASDRATGGRVARNNIRDRVTPHGSATPRQTSQPTIDDVRRRSASVDDRNFPVDRTPIAQEPEPDVSNPAYQFKIGIGVGVALGECFLQVQRLESSVLQIHQISDEIRDFMNFLQDSFQGAEASPQRDGQAGGASPIPEDAERGDSTITPFQQVKTLNGALERSQLDCTKRMTSVLKGLKQLQMRLEDMDAVNEKFNQQNTRDSADVQMLRAELEKARRQCLSLKGQADGSRAEFEETKARLTRRETQLDSDAEAIERQAEHLRADTERLLKEKEDVRRQKDNWQALIEEQKELKEQLNRREQMLNESQKQLIALQNNLAQKEAHLHRKAKKLRGRERRINQSLMQLRPQGNTPFFDGSSYAGSDYAPSEASSKLTYFSDGDTEIASVNSFDSDDDIDAAGFAARR